MLGDLEEEMERRGLNAVLVSGGGSSRELYYLTRVRIPRGGIYLKKRGEEPVLIVGNVDLKRAEKSIVKGVRTFTEYGYEELIRRYGPSKAAIHLYEKVLTSHGVEGPIGFYGVKDVGEAYRIIEGLKKLGYEITCEARPNLLDRLMETKDPLEISEVRKVGSQVEGVMEEAIDILRENVDRNGGVTIGDVKRQVQILMAEADLYPVEGFILSSGEETSDPHDPGDERKKIERDTPIILDFYPQGKNMLYFDITRTITVGEAPKKLRRMYEDVLEAQNMAYDLLNEGVSFSDAVGKVCDSFERKGYPTIKRLLTGDVRLERGFIHSLGHGVGWSLSDLPRISLMSRDTLRMGQIFTLEPGLYEPGLGGVRIEDVYTSNGRRIDQISKINRTLEI